MSKVTRDSDLAGIEKIVKYIDSNKTLTSRKYQCRVRIATEGHLSGILLVVDHAETRFWAKIMTNGCFATVTHDLHENDPNYDKTHVRVGFRMKNYGKPDYKSAIEYVAEAVKVFFSNETPGTK